MEVCVEAAPGLSRWKAPVARVARALALHGVGGEEVAIRLVDGEEMAALNLAFRGRRGATDVLSFWSDEPGRLGDVALCLPVARAQAAGLGHPLTVELAVLVCHAFCHLWGLDHDRSPEETVRQAEVEMGLLSASGVDVSAALSRRGLPGRRPGRPGQRRVRR
jgi:probable rRNA maturation factor